MATGRITKRSVDAAEPGFLWDDDLRGFGLKTTDAGARSYVFQYRLGGRETNARRYTIGRPGSPWTPTTARAEAERLALLTKRGIDPQEADRERRRQSIDLAFGPYGDRFLSLYVQTEWRGSYAFAESILRLHVVPVLGKRPLPTISRGDIAEVLDRLPVKSVALRRNVYAVVRRLFRWAVGRGDLDRSPLEGFEAPASVASRDRVLADDELALVWRAAGNVGRPFAPIFRLLIATGQRREEIAGMNWQELSRLTATWTLPSDRAKNGRAHVIPLSGMTIQILDDVGGGADWPTKGFVFSTTGRTAVSGHSRAKRRLDAAIVTLLDEDAASRDVAPWRVHDLRRTMATGFQRLGIGFEVTEAVLNHISGARSGVAGVYQRHDWAVEKRDALDRWASFVDNLVHPAQADHENNVTPIRASASVAA